MVSVSVMDALHIAGNAEKPGERKQATEARQARKAKQTLAAGNEAEETQKAEETQEAKPTDAGDASELLGPWGVVGCRHVLSPIFDG
jgi:hypothetical protein